MCCITQLLVWSIWFLASEGPDKKHLHKVCLLLLFRAENYNKGKKRMNGYMAPDYALFENVSPKDQCF